MTRKLIGVVACVLLAACGDATGPDYADLGGTFNGSVQAAGQDYVIAGALELSITQARGSLSGSWILDGQLEGPTGTAVIQNTGTLTGTVQAGSSPDLALVLQPAGCAAQAMSFPGSYDAADDVLSITGSLRILSGTCTVLATFPVTIELT